MSVERADELYRATLEQMPDALEQAFRDLVTTGPLPIDGNEVTRAILLRLRSYYQAQHRIKQFLGKRVIGAGSDYFVETVLFYLKALVETHQLGLQVVAERQIRLKRGVLQPDISIWKGDTVLAAVECKTQLGWDRHGWQSNFLQREQMLQREYPSARAFLLVLTTKNWGGFGHDPKLGNQYFALSRVWMEEIIPENMDDDIVTPIEGLMRAIVAMSETL